jgi:hypothetical protein
MKAKILLDLSKITSYPITWVGGKMFAGTSLLLTIKVGTHEIQVYKITSFKYKYKITINNEFFLYKECGDYKTMLGDIVSCISFLEEKNKIGMNEELNIIVKVINEDAFCDAGNVGGMGDVVASQPSTNIGTTMGSDFYNGGGTTGSGDITNPFNKKPYQKGKTKRATARFAKIFKKQQDYTMGQSKKSKTLKKFSDFIK